MRHRLKFAGKKCIRMVLLLLGVSLAAFLLMAASPLDPLQTNVGQAALGSMSPEQIAQLEDYWGTNTPVSYTHLAKVDFHRSVRQGAAEVIYGAGKTPEQIAGIARTMGKRGCRNIQMCIRDRDQGVQEDRDSL